MTTRETAAADAIHCASALRGEQLYRYESNRRQIAHREAGQRGLTGQERLTYIAHFLQTWDTWQHDDDLAHCGFVSFHVIPHIVNVSRAGQTISAEEAVDYCLAHRSAIYPPPMEDRDVLINAVARRIPTLYAANGTVRGGNALVRHAAATDNAVPRVHAGRFRWGEAVSTEGWSVTIRWFDGKTTDEPFWRLHRGTMLDREELTQVGILPQLTGAGK